MHGRRVALDALLRAVAAALRSAGVPDADATVAARVIVEADACGRSSHGVARLPIYLERLRSGAIRAAAPLDVLHDTGGTFGLDGNDGLGEVALSAALNMALDRAGRFGVAMGLVRNINNPGMLAAYGMAAVRADRILIIACNAAPAMAPHGARDAWLGTNPLCIAIPRASGAPVVLDMATSVAAKGVVRAAAREGRPIPAGWALDLSGDPTTDPEAALTGTLLPVGGAKGAGLALMIDLIAGVLAGSGAGPTVRGLHDGRPSRVGALLIAADPARFMDMSAFGGMVDAYLAEMASLPPAVGSEAVLVPGERAWRERERSQADGVLIDEAAWARLMGPEVSDARTP